MAKPVDEALLSSGSAKADDADASWSGKRDDADRCWTFPMIEGLAAIWNAPTGAPSTSAAAAAPPRQDLIIVALARTRCVKVTMTGADDDDDARTADKPNQHILFIYLQDTL